MIDTWRPYEPCRENELVAVCWRAVIHVFGSVNFDLPAPQSAEAMKKWYEARKQYHVTREPTSAKYRGLKYTTLIIDGHYDK